MQKLTKKLGVAVLAFVAAMAFSSVAFAATIGPDGTYETDADAGDNTITIPKQIVFVNDEASSVREPNLVYTYTLSAADPSSATVEDEDGVKATVKQGVIAAATSTTATVTYADTNHASASSDGIADEKTFSFTFDPTKFSAPGIYRYQIVESVSPTKASVGVTEAPTYSNTRYLDVYVQRTTTGASTMKIYGYVLSEDTASTSFKGNPTTENLDKKSAGFVNTSSTSGSQADVDVYETQNFELTKDVQGTLADPNNNFPVSIALTPASGVTAPKLDVTLASGAVLNGTSTDTLGTYITLGTLSGTVKDDSKITLVGIPAGSTVAITETNNTPDSYKVKAGTSAGAVDLFAEATIASGANAGPTSTQTFTAKQVAFITNTLDAISPTGIVMRYGPFGFMLAAGIALLFVATRRREEDARA